MCILLTTIHCARFDCDFNGDHHRECSWKITGPHEITSKIPDIESSQDGESISDNNIELYTHMAITNNQGQEQCFKTYVYLICYYNTCDVLRDTHTNNHQCSNRGNDDQE